MNPVYLLLLLVCFTCCQGQDPKQSSNKTVSFASVMPVNSIWRDDYYLRSDPRRPSSPESFVNGILHDKRGNTWFATWNGLYMRDGSKAGSACYRQVCKHDLTNFNENNDHIRQLSTDFTSFSELQKIKDLHVFCLAEDKNGNIWFGSWIHGLGRYDGKTFQFLDTGDGLAGNFVHCLLIDNEGKLWAGTEGGVSCLDGNSFVNYTKGNGLCGNTVFSLMQDRTGKIWMGTDQGVCSYNDKKFMRVEDKNGPAFGTVRSIIEDRSGNVWIGGEHGASRFNGKTFTNFNNTNGLNDNLVYCMYEDKINGEIWFSTCDQYLNGSGVCKYDGKSFSGLTREKGLPDNRIFTITGFPSPGTGKNLIWFGTSIGVSGYDGKDFIVYAAQLMDGC